jgi:hypothetical protein
VLQIRQFARRLTAGAASPRQCIRGRRSPAQGISAPRVSLGLNGGDPSILSGAKEGRAAGKGAGRRTGEVVWSAISDANALTSLSNGIGIHIVRGAGWRCEKQRGVSYSCRRQAQHVVSVTA